MKTDTPSPSARSSRRSAGVQSILNLILVFGILIILNYLGFKFYSHKDLSLSQFYSLSPKTIDVLKNLDSPVTIYTYLDMSGQAQAAEADQIQTLLKEYQRVGGKNIVLEKIDPNFDITRAAALQKKLNFDGNDHLVIFEYKDHAPRFVKEDDLYEVSPITQQVGAFKGEQELTSALIGVVEGKSAKIYFTEGHGEHSPQDATSPAGYGILSANLKNENMSVLNLNLAQQGEVPADADAVVVAGPSISFSKIEVDTLDKYLANNGKLIVLLDPYVVSGLEDLLQKYGMKYEDDLVLFRAMTATGTEMTVPLAAFYQGGFSTTEPITEKFANTNIQMLIQDARSITLAPNSAPKTQFLLQTDPNAWGWISKDANMAIDPRQLTYNKTTDIAGPLVVAAVFDGGMVTDPATKATIPATRLIAVGCAKFLQNDTMDATGSNFFGNCLDWMVKKNAVLDISPKKPQEYGVSLLPISYRTVIWCALFFVPGAALVMGIMTWFSRRK